MNKKHSNLVALAPDELKNPPNASVMQIYNFISNFQNSVLDNYIDNTIMITNKQLMNYCTNVKKITNPGLFEMNEVVVDMMKTITASSRNGASGRCFSL